MKKQKRNKKIKLEIGDSEEIRYPSNYFDAVTVAFGVRNFENLDKGLSEIRRVLSPGGDLIILETAVPQKIPMRQFYELYTHFIMPFTSWIFLKINLLTNICLTLQIGFRSEWLSTIF